MPRIRSIKPGFFANEGLSAVSEPAQILAGGLLCYADDEGYFNANPGLVKAAVFPLREPSNPVPDLLHELSRIGYTRFGTGKDGKRYGHVVNFSEHQKVSHPVPSKIKGLGIIWEVSGGSPEVLQKSPEVLRPELNGIELNGTEEDKKKKHKAHSVRPQISPPDFVTPAIWDAFVEMRNKIRKPMTPFAAELITKRLIQFKNRGQPPDEVLKQSIVNTWQNVFELKESRDNGNIAAPRGPTSNEAADQELERQLGRNGRK